MLIAIILTYLARTGKLEVLKQAYRAKVNFLKNVWRSKTNLLSSKLALLKGMQLSVRRFK